MTWAGRHELNVGCLKARGGYNYLGRAIGWGHGWVVVNGGGVWGGLEFSMGKPQGRFSVNGRDGWHGRLGCVLKGGHGWNRGFSGWRRGGGRSMTCHWSSWARTGPYIWYFSLVGCFVIGSHIDTINLIHILKGFLNELVFVRFFTEPLEDSQLGCKLSLNLHHYQVLHIHNVIHIMQNKINLCTLPKFPS